jgi:hypothetical protein
MLVATLNSTFGGVRPPTVMSMRGGIFVGLFLSAAAAHAYPEYAVRYNINSCTACHLSPVGGGPRTINGKLFGAHGYAVNTWLQQDYVSADFRALFYAPERPTDSKSGMGIMSGSVAGHVALDPAKKFHLVIEHNLAGFSQAGARDTYALYRFNEEGKPAWFETLLVGRFREPFGIVTDEHRTYTRIQSGTEYYSEEAGALLSGEAGSTNLHYDIAYVDGENTGGQSLSQNGAGQWGSVVNLRWMPGAAFLGTSYSYHRHDPRSDSRYALSFYAVLSIARLTDDRVPLTLELEHVRTWNWGANLGRGFVNDPGYAATLTHTQADGWYGLLRWDFSQRFALLYKFDWLTPDRSFAADYYQRYGLGLRYWLGPGVEVQVRGELARATPTSEKDSRALGAENASWALLTVRF